MAKRIPKVRCPLCGLSKVLVRKGTNAAMSGRKVRPDQLGLFHFGRTGPEEKPTLYFVVSHGRTTDPTKESGFKTVGEMTIAEMLEDPNWSWIVDDLRAGAENVIRRIDDARGKRSGS